MEGSRWVSPLLSRPGVEEVTSVDSGGSRPPLEKEQVVGVGGGRLRA